MLVYLQIKIHGKKKNDILHFPFKTNSSENLDNLAGYDCAFGLQKDNVGIEKFAFPTMDQYMYTFSRHMFFPTISISKQYWTV